MWTSSGMFFFDDKQGDPIGERLSRVAAEHGTLPDQVITL